ncbi:MAG: hypothetical protein JW731_06255 [Bacteroidales bacterium]|nr:hypothetical protein [Bacteroidales bacterium]
MKTMNLIKIISFCSLFIFGSLTANAQTAQIGTVHATPGSSVVVPLDVTGFTSIGSISFKIDFDGILMSFQSAVNVTGNNAINPQISFTGSQVTISWFDVMGQNFPDGTWLEMTFNYVDCSIDLSFDESQCFVTDFIGNPITVVYTDGMVSPDVAAPATTEWTGSADQDWSNPANWNNGVPGCVSDVVINSGLNYPMIPATKATVAVGNLVIAAGGALTVEGSLLVDDDLTIQSNGSIIENGTVEVLGQTFVEQACNGGADVYHMISTPLDYAQAIIFLGQYLREWDETAQTWNNIVAPSTVLSKGKGYSLNAVSPQTFVFDNGDLNHGDVTKSGLSYTMGGPDPLLAGFHLVGNPFPSALDFTMAGWNLTDVANNVWVWNNGNYMVGDGAATGTLPGDIIPALNGFFVMATAAGGSVTMPQAARVHGFVPFYKKSSEGRLAFNISGNGFEDNIVVNVNDEATPGLDQNLDAFKLFGLDAAPQLYTMAEEAPLTLNYFPSTDFVNLYLEVGADATYTISAEGMETFASNVTLHLEDLKEGTIVDLKDTPEYNFEAMTGDDPERFMLHFGTVGIENSAAEQIHVFANHGQVYVNLPANINGQVDIYNVMGQKIASEEVYGGSNSVSVNSGINYIVRVVTESGVKTEKVFVE